MDFIVPQVVMYVMLCSHLGRPNGEKFKKFSMGPAAEVVEEKLGTLIQLRKNIGSSEVKAACADPAPGRVILLVNPRFYIKEEGTTRSRLIPRRPKNSNLPCQYG